jgi:transposase
MSRSLKIRQPRLREIRQLLALVEEPLEGPPPRRAQAILLHHEGVSATDIAATLEAHVNTIYADLHAFDQHGVAAVHQVRPPGVPPQLTPWQRAEIYRIADQSPQDVGLSYGRWSLSKLQTYLKRQGSVPQISRKHLWRVLKKGGSTCAAFSAS